jgi:hypothetical protein
MSGGAVFREVLRRLQARNLPPQAVRDALAALEAARHGGAPLTILYEAAAEAGLPRDALLQRAAAIYLAFAAGSLADDLADGDCNYLPPRVAPGIAYLLLQLSWAELNALGLPPPALAESATALVEAAAEQGTEVRVTEWDAERYRTVGEALVARQWTAYLTLLWYGTPLAGKAGLVGAALGFAGHVAEDCRGGDRRFTSMSAADQTTILALARDRLNAARAAELRVVGLVAASIAAHLEEKP